MTRKCMTYVILMVIFVPVMQHQSTKRFMLLNIRPAKDGVGRYGRYGS